ncbi:MAG: hypothetical protein IT238_02650 [Bacteroidia bacterium]|nr:hypothetical protein [Bacteroidia bacterium]MCZ2247791.1 hypothetical protein [Bacteroidia bacterium]
MFKIKITVFFTAIIILALKFIFPESNILSWDVFGYYLYLPARFIYHDPYLTRHNWLNDIVEQYQSTATLYQLYDIPDTANRVIKYSMGMSYLYAPFFFLAHWLAPFFHYPQDGYSGIYALSIEYGMLFYSFIGLYYLLKILYSYFNSITANIAFILIVFGTNYIQLTVQYSLLTHVPLFTLYCLLIYFTIQWDRYKQWTDFYKLTLLCGLITIIRPNEIVCVFIPLLWNNISMESFKNKWQWINASYLKLTGSLLLFCIPIAGQLLYWKATTGQWFFYSYLNPGEGLDFLSPHTLPFLFSFRKGWLVYSPVVIVAIIGVFIIARKNKAIFPATAVVLGLSVYLVSCWSCWWYAGGSYSQRAILSTYPLLAIGLGYAIDAIPSRIKFAFYALLLFLLTLNLFQAWQFKQDIIDHERMTYQYYKKIWFKTERPENAESLLLVNRGVDFNESITDIDRYDEKRVVNNKFNSVIPGKEYIFCDTLGFDDHSSVWMQQGQNEFVDAFASTYKAVTNSDHFWIKVSIYFFIPPGQQAKSPNIVTVFNHNNQPYKYRNIHLPDDSIKINQWNYLEYYYLSPEVRTVNDDFKVYIWHPNANKVFIDNLAVSFLTPKKDE